MQNYAGKLLSSGRGGLSVSRSAAWYFLKGSERYHCNALPTASLSSGSASRLLALIIDCSRSDCVSSTRPQNWLAVMFAVKPTMIHHRPTASFYVIVWSQRFLFLVLLFLHFPSTFLSSPPPPPPSHSVAPPSQPS